MSGKFQDDGVSAAASAIRGTWNTTPVKVHLYKNDVTPTTSSVLGDFTESDFAGYAAQNASSWSAPVVSAHIATITAAALTYTRSSTGTAQNAYGYYITDSGSTLLYAAERFATAPRVLTNNGDSETVTPKVNVRDLST
jgi:hypothetical protein